MVAQEPEYRLTEDLDAPTLLVRSTDGCEEIRDAWRGEWICLLKLPICRGCGWGARCLPNCCRGSIRPLSAHIKLTENCQAKCISCDYWKSRWQDHLDTERAIGLVNEIGAAGIRGLRLTGGEPLLRRDLFEVLGKADTSPLKRIILQTNGLLIKKLHREINDSPITNVCVSIDGLKETNDQIRGIRGYFELGLEGIRQLRGKKVAISVTMNRISAAELETLADVAHGVGAEVEVNILSRNLFFFKDADIDSMWPGQAEVAKIAKFLRDNLKRPGYEVDYVTRYYQNCDRRGAAPACWVISRCLCFQMAMC